MPRVAPPNLVERRMSRFLREPPSVRLAASVIVSATAVVVGIGGVAMWVLDHGEYPNVFVGLWWALQTVTTVGYGDVTPKNPSGRLVASVVMLEGIALLSITIAAITSTFVARAQREQSATEEAADSPAESRIERRLDELAERLDRIEALVREPKS
jgi:voltage-gated potassium channel Kch